MTKPTKWHVRPAKTQISLGIRPVWSESSLCAKWVAKDPSFLHLGCEDSDQTWRMPRLIWVFAGRTCHFVGFVMRQLILLISNYCDCLLHTSSSLVVIMIITDLVKPNPIAQFAASLTANWVAASSAQHGPATLTENITRWSLYEEVVHGKTYFFKKSACIIMF